MRKKSPDPYLQSVRATIRRRKLLSPNDTVLAAVSAGPDSTALVAALAALRDAGELAAVTALHVDHGLRPGGAQKRAGGGAARALRRVPRGRGAGRREPHRDGPHPHRPGGDGAAAVASR